jgi:hypothetical protein
MKPLQQNFSEKLLLRNTFKKAAAETMNLKAKRSEV